MLAKNVDGFEYGEDGKVCGVRSGDEVARCKMVICDPSYAEPAKTQVQGQIIRAICILGAPIPDTHNKDGGPAVSCQIILPQKQMKRKNDIYVMMVSWAHQIAAKDKYVAIVSTVVETANPEKEIEPALALLGPILEKFVQVSEFRSPLDDGTKDNVFVTTSYGAQSHFEDDTVEVLRMYKTFTGTDLDLSYTPDPDDES